MSEPSTYEAALRRNNGEIEDHRNNGMCHGNSSMFVNSGVSFEIRR